MKEGARSVFIWAVIVAAILFSVNTAIKQLSEDASPAAAFCEKAVGAGYECVIAPVTYQAQVAQIDDGMGSQSVVLIISDGKKIIQVVPLQ